MIIYDTWLLGYLCDLLYFYFRYCSYFYTYKPWLPFVHLINQISLSPYKLEKDLFSTWLKSISRRLFFNILLDYRQDKTTRLSFTYWPLIWAFLNIDLHLLSWTYGHFLPGFFLQIALTILSMIELIIALPLLIKG